MRLCNSWDILLRGQVHFEQAERECHFDALMFGIERQDESLDEGNEDFVAGGGFDGEQRSGFVEATASVRCCGEVDIDDGADRYTLISIGEIKDGAADEVADVGRVLVEFAALGGGHYNFEAAERLCGIDRVDASKVKDDAALVLAERKPPCDNFSRTRGGLFATEARRGNEDAFAGLEAFGKIREELGEDLAFPPLRTKQPGKGEPLLHLFRCWSFAARDGFFRLFRLRSFHSGDRTWDYRRVSPESVERQLCARPDSGLTVPGSRLRRLFADDRSRNWNAFFDDVEREAMLQLHAGSAEDGANGTSSAPLLANNLANVGRSDAKTQNSRGSLWNYLDTDGLRMVDKSFRQTCDKILHPAASVAVGMVLCRKHVGTFGERDALCPVVKPRLVWVRDLRLTVFKECKLAHFEFSNDFVASSCETLTPSGWMQRAQDERKFMSKRNP